MRYDLTERQTALMRHRITAEAIATVAKQNAMDGIVASIPDAAADSKFVLKQDAAGAFYIEIVEAEKED